MTDNTVYVRRYNGDEVPDVNLREAWRYAGYLRGSDKADDSLKDLLNQVIKEVLPGLSYKVCYRRFDITWEDGLAILPFDQKSLKLAKCLEGCNEVIIMAATIGIDIDRKIARNQRIAPTKALLMQALGAERIESFSNMFCSQLEEELKKENLKCSKRYSPGYGDLKLETQVDVFKLLDCSRQIGISLNQSLLMSPSKSITAIIGLGPDADSCRDRSCKDCDKLDCDFRMI